MKQFSEILEILRDSEYSVEEFVYDPNIFEDELGPIDSVDSHGGEDEGSDWWEIFYFRDHDIYMKITGYYSSGYGTEFEGWDEEASQVKPVKKTVTIYE